MAKKVGFKFITWENQGQSSQWVQGMDAAVNQKVDLIDLLAGTDPARPRAPGPGRQGRRHPGHRLAL